MEILGCILTILFGIFIFCSGILTAIGSSAFGKTEWVCVFPIVIGLILLYYGFHELPFDIVRH